MTAQKETQVAEQNIRQRHNWLPTPGNMLFTILVMGLFVLATSAGAIPLNSTPSNNGTAGTSHSTIGYQGYLSDSTGTPVNGSLDMVFRLYATSAGGTALWSETQDNVVVNEGLFSVLLGSSNLLSPQVFSETDDLWLGITVGTDQEMVPREQITSVPVSMATILPAIPSGAIIMWSGSIGSIPDGWLLCNGANGTPDLRNRFVVGAGSSYAVGATGGVDTVNLSHSHTVDAHTHGAGSYHARIYVSAGEGLLRYRGVTGENYFVNREANLSGIADVNHSVSAATDIAGVSAPSSPGTDSQLSATTENRPPYFSLAYICKE